MALGLREKLLLPIVLLILVGLGASVYLAHSRSSQTLKAMIEWRLRREVRLTATQMGYWLEARKTDLATWSTDRAFRDALVETGYYGRSAREGASEILREYQRGYPYYDSLGLLDPEGMLVADSVPPGVEDGGLADGMADRNWFRAAIEGRRVVSDVLTSRRTGNPVFVVAVPVRAEGRIVGVLAGAVHLAAFGNQFVRAVKMGRECYAYLVGPDGRVLTHSDHRAARLPDDVRLTPFGPSILARREGMVNFSLGGGIRRIGAFATLDETGWVFLETHDLGEAMRLVDETATFLLVAGVVIVAGVMLVVAGLYRHTVAGRLDALLAALARIESGDLAVRIDRRGGDDEFTRLVDAFNRMAERLEESLHDLRESERHHRITLASIGDAVIATDVEGRVNRMNPVAESLTGWSQEEATGRLLPEVFHIVKAETRAEVENPAAKVIRVGEVVGLANHTLLVARDGTERQIADSGAPIREEDGTLVGVVLVFRDVTEQHRMEEQFRQAQKLETVGRLAGGVAHDFNNLLGGIIGFAELLVRRLQGKEERLERYARSILETSERAADLTRKLLAFSRKGKSVSTPLDLHDVVDEVTLLLEHSLPPDIAVEKRLTAPRSTVTGDPAQLQSALLNLGVNARDAMPEGGTLTFATEEVTLDGTACARAGFELAPGSYLRLHVVDTGTGMDEATQAKVFEPFFTTKGVGEGTGLGLAAVYGTVRDHHGAIQIASTPGRGSRFVLDFPLALGEGGAAASSTGASAADGLPRGSGCILLVDDEPVIREMGRAQLEDLGYDVLLAADGEEAVTLYRQERGRIRLVVLDVVMPRLNGPKTLAALQAIDPDVSVLVTSGFAFNAETDAMLREGARGFVPKPYHAGELARKVRDALDAKEASPPEA